MGGFLSGRGELSVGMVVVGQVHAEQKLGVQQSPLLLLVN
jgi:hypothetical protein